MHYELYVDSLFLVNFVMNLYLLLLVDRSTFRTATRRRLLLGAAAGGVLGIVPLLLPGTVLVKGALAAVAGTVGSESADGRSSSLSLLLSVYLTLQ